MLTSLALFAVCFALFSNADITVDVDDRDPQIIYSPEWSSSDDHCFGGDTCQNKTFDGCILVPFCTWTYYWNGSSHLTTIPGASVVFAFQGTGIKWYGDADTNNAIARVDLDGVVEPSNATYAESYQSQRILFEKQNLPNAKHILNITHDGVDDQYLSVDRFTYTTIVSENSRALSGGSVAGIFLGIIALFIITVATVKYNRRRAHFTRHSAVVYSPVMNPVDPFALPHDFEATPWTPDSLSSGRPPLSSERRSFEIGPYRPAIELVPLGEERVEEEPPDYSLVSPGGTPSRRDRKMAHNANIRSSFYVENR